MTPPDPSTTFSLAGRSLKLTTQEDIEPHLKPLIKTTTFTHIDLSGNTLGVPASSYLSTLLPSQTSLTSINLADIFTSRLLSEIPPALSSILTSLLPLPQLQSIDLSDNAFGLNTVAPLVDFLSQHIPLRRLVLQNNGLGPAAGAKVADALASLAEKKTERRKNGEEGKDVPDLETVVCGRNRLESGSMEAWARCFSVNDRVKEVKMVQNGIRPEGVVMLLTKGLGKCEGLETVDLQDNTFTYSGASALSQVLPNWKELRELGVGDSLLGSKGAKILAQALGRVEGSRVEVLRLQYNEIDTTGVGELLKAARNMLKLRRVELNGNKFAEEDEAVEGLRELLERRKEEHEGEQGGGDQEWGLDELSDLEEESDEEEGEDEEEPEEKEDEDDQEARRDRMLKEQDQAEEEKVAEKKDKEVDDLADALDKTHV